MGRRSTSAGSVARELVYCVDHIDHRRRRRHGLAVVAERLYVEGDGLLDRSPHLVRRVAAGAAGDAAGKVGDVGRVTAVVGLFRSPPRSYMRNSSAAPRRGIVLIPVEDRICLREPKKLELYEPATEASTGICSAISIATETISEVISHP